MWRACALVFGLFLALSPGRVGAHTGEPAALRIHIDSSDPERMLAVTTFGLVASDDGGDSWAWLCPDGVGYEEELVVPDALQLGGRLVVGASQGVMVSPNGCDWTVASGTSGLYLRVLRSGRGPEHALGLFTNALGGYMYESEVWETRDGGRSWSRIAQAPPDFLAHDVAVAPDDEQRLYLAGVDGSADAREQAWLRSDDGGASWERFPIAPADADTRTEIGGVGPEGRVYAVTRRLVGDGGESFVLRASDDGAATFETVVALDGAIPAVAMAPNGSTIAIGGPEHGVSLADTTSQGLEPISSLRASCLVWADDGLYACADRQEDGFVAGVWRGEGFASVLTTAEICGPPPCEAGSVVAEACTPQWEQERRELDGACRTGGGGGSSGGSGEPVRGCGCALDGRSPTGSVAAVLVAALAALRRRFGR